MKVSRSFFYRVNVCNVCVDPFPEITASHFCNAKRASLWRVKVKGTSLSNPFGK
jgi:hypothetical protein